MRLFLANIASLAALSLSQIHCQAGDDLLKGKIVRSMLNHNEPALIEVGTHGVTSLEFPYQIEAIDGYGFSQAPGPGDVFQICYSKGTNYFSVRALKTGVSGNLTVVLDQKVYSFLFQESGSPSFVNIFGPGNDGGLPAPGERMVAEKERVAAQTQLSGLLEEAKDYPSLKNRSPHALESLQVVEPGKKIALAPEVESTIRRVLMDHSLRAAVLEVEVDNRSGRDFCYHPREILVKVKNRVYSPATEDGPGVVKPRTKASLFFAVNDIDRGQENDWLWSDDFDLAIKEHPEAKSEELTFSQPPADYLPTASTVGPVDRDPEPVLAPAHTNDQWPQTASLPSKHLGRKKSVKKIDPKPESSAKEGPAKAQKALPKKLFGWL